EVVGVLVGGGEIEGSRGGDKGPGEGGRQAPERLDIVWIGQPAAAQVVRDVAAGEVGVGEIAEERALELVAAVARHHVDANTPERRLRRLSADVHDELLIVPVAELEVRGSARCPWSSRRAGTSGPAAIRRGWSWRRRSGPAGRRRRDPTPGCPTRRGSASRCPGTHRLSAARRELGVARRWSIVRSARPRRESPPPPHPFLDA